MNFVEKQPHLYAVLDKILWKATAVPLRSCSKTNQPDLEVGNPTQDRDGGWSSMIFKILSNHSMILWFTFAISWEKKSSSEAWKAQRNLSVFYL